LQLDQSHKVGCAQNIVDFALPVLFVQAIILVLRGTSPRV
jgi:hypothetical protein